MAKQMDELAYVDSTGFHIADFEDFLNYNRDAMKRIYGSDINLDADSQDGQLVTHIAQSQYDLASLCAAIFASYSPSSASGESLSRQVKINGIRRQEATNSTVDLKIIGKAGTGIKKGRVRDDADRLWILPDLVTIPAGGEIVVTATADEAGEIRAAAGAVSRIATPTEGWMSVTNEAEAAAGVSVESDVALRRRQAVSTAMPSQAILKGILGSLLNIVGVTRAKVYDNDTSVVDANGIPAHSISVVVEGGDASAIAETIRHRKSTGTGTYGTTSITLTDPQLMPIKISFFRPTVVHVYVKVTVKPLAGFSSTYVDEIKAEVAEYINGLDIGSTVYLSKLFVPANLAASDHDNTYDIKAIEIGSSKGALSAKNVVTAFNAVPFCKADYIEVLTNDES